VCGERDELVLTYVVRHTWFKGTLGRTLHVMSIYEREGETEREKRKQEGGIEINREVIIPRWIVSIELVYYSCDAQLTCVCIAHCCGCKFVPICRTSTEKLPRGVH
jgi:hypothetical protein